MLKPSTNVTDDQIGRPIQGEVRMKKFAMFVFVVLALAIPFAVSAQEATPTNPGGTRFPNPFIVTEAEINDAWRVTSPANRRVADVVVDLQPVQSVISSVITLRAPRGTSTTVLNATAVYTPSVENGRLYWTLESATVNGAAATSQQITIINTAIGSSYRNFVRANIRAGQLTDVVITDSEMQFFYK